MTFSDVCETYLKYSTDLAKKVLIIFDGYSDKMISTKSARQEIRSKGKASMTYEFDLQMTVQTDKSAFLANPSNKGRLLDFLSSRFKELGVDTDQSRGDADYAIVQTALKESLKAPILFGKYRYFSDINLWSK